MSEQVTITSVNTKPELDPYHSDTGGATTTTLRVDPEYRKASVYQEYDDNATPSDEWHRRVLTMPIEPNPDEEATREYLASEAGQALLAAVCDGHSIDWDGNNMAGNLTPAAEEAWQELEQALTNLPESEWSLWDTSDYLMMVDVDADATDEELATLAAEIEAELPAEHVVLTADVLAKLRQMRDAARDRVECA